jgi:hypothetical protein
MREGWPDLEEIGPLLSLFTAETVNAFRYIFTIKKLINYLINSQKTFALLCRNDDQV